MGFSFTVTKQKVFGDVRIAYGTFSNSGGSAGGALNLHQECGWHLCKGISLQHTGAAATSNAPSVNATFPCDASSVPIVTDADKNGLWFAFGV